MKTKKFVAILSIALGCSFTGNSQTYKDFDLSSFITPDIVRNELDFSLNSSGEINDYRANTQDKASLNANFGTSFYRLKNTRPYKGTQSVSLSLKGNYLNNKLDNVKSKGCNINLQYISENRFYKPNNFFYAVNGSSYLYYLNENYKEKDETKKKNTRAMIWFGGGIGKGRIESVTDARQAIYIIENLSKKGVLDRKLSDNEILTLAKQIAIVKNKRFFDARHHLIEEITAVDSFFVQNHLLKSSGASYFTTLYDYWMYGDRFERGAGLELYAGLNGGYRYDQFKIDNTKFTSGEFTPLTSATLSLKYEKPVNLFWQQSAAISLQGDYYLANTNSSSVEYNYNNYKTYLSGHYGWGYYPNSRTNINFSLQEFLSWGGNKSKTNESSLNSQWGSNTYLKFTTYYYFSPQLRLTAEASGGIAYGDMKFPDETDKIDRMSLGWTGNFQLTLTYSLF